MCQKLHARKIMSHCFLLAIYFFSSCNAHAVDDKPAYQKYVYKDKHIDTADLLIINIELFKETKAWPLAKAVYEQDTEKIDELLKPDPALVEASEPKFGVSLLEWAIYNRRYYAARELLKMGANPNRVSENPDAHPAVFVAAHKQQLCYLELLTDFKADLNLVYVNIAGFHETPVYEASVNLANLKFIVEHGGDIRRYNDTVNYVLGRALDAPSLDCARYLIIDLKANYRIPVMKKEEVVLYAKDILERELMPSQSKATADELIRYMDEHAKDDK